MNFSALTTDLPERVSNCRRQSGLLFQFRSVSGLGARPKPAKGLAARAGPAEPMEIVNSRSG